MRRRRFNPAVLKMLERKRAEKRGRANSLTFAARNRDPHSKNALTPTGWQRMDDTGKPTGKAFLFHDAPAPPPKPPEAPPRASQLTLPDAVAARVAGLYAALHAEHVCTQSRTKTRRRKKATSIDASRLKLAVQRVSKLSATQPRPGRGETLDGPEIDGWLEDNPQFRPTVAAPETRQ
jgi:hypothetical protein